MELICKITDKDIGEEIIEMENPQLRLGARGIVIRKDGKIAIFNKSNKNEYKFFIAKVLEDTKQLSVTDKEKEEGAKLIWETPKRALELVKESFNNLVASKYGSIYSTKFIVLRDRKILEKYLELQFFQK